MHFSSACFLSVLVETLVLLGTLALEEIQTYNIQWGPVNNTSSRRPPFSSAKSPRCTLFFLTKKEYPSACPSPPTFLLRSYFLEYVCVIFFFLNIWWHMPLFLIYYFYRLIMTRVHFTYSNFCFGAAWWSGRDVVWRLVCFGSALSWLWLGLKSAEDLSHSPHGYRQCGH